ncbi:MAG: tRNA preQ1(34) S-adenosylmethionine ribosyltransferase-isomerase QueA [Chloroflexota bacterium]|nr:tRNA preQ1(34) S-adenosylmethionine ribosyltransferase-isomerase QueA [Chloroflexota bacterium]
MRLSDFDYTLPEELIAQEPVEPRDAARLLLLPVRGDHARPRTDLHVRDLPDLLRPGDLLVANRSRVLPARVRGRLAGGGRAEFLLLRQHGRAQWEALARPARRLRPGDVVAIIPGLAVRVAAAFENGIRHIQVECTTGDEPDAALLAAGSVPLPPYIRGWVGDPQRYQTIFADTLGSAAAPTAGLHFTRDLLDRLVDRGVGWATVVLHVGVDTFRPIVHEDPGAHRMHREWYVVPSVVEQQVSATRSAGGRIIAVGTTVVRTLESWAATGKSEGWTDLFIVPGHEFRVVDGLLTNFHLPRSTLLMLVSALAGRERTLAAYDVAARERYRFYSFGDCMLIV